ERGRSHPAPRGLRPRPREGGPTERRAPSEGVGGGNRRLRSRGEGPRLQRIPVRTARPEVRLLPRCAGEQPLLAAHDRPRVRSSTREDVHGTARGRRSRGPEPERRERRRRGADGDLCPCRASIPPGARRAVLLPAVPETASAAQTAGPSAKARRRTPCNLDPSPERDRGRPVPAAPQGPSVLRGPPPSKCVPGVRLPLRRRRERGRVPVRTRRRVAPAGL